MMFAIRAWLSASDCASMAAVWMYPGSTPLTVMRSRASSTAAVLMNALIPPFDAA